MNLKEDRKKTVDGILGELDSYLCRNDYSAAEEYLLKTLEQYFGGFCYVSGFCESCLRREWYS